jgi:hypothetical protein
MAFPKQRPCASAVSKRKEEKNGKGSSDPREKEIGRR